jgi:hypothetical protein
MKFNEFTVVTSNKGKILKKTPTKRASVDISEIDAREMNTDFDKTKLFYEKPIKKK